MSARAPPAAPSGPRSPPPVHPERPTCHLLLLAGALLASPDASASEQDQGPWSLQLHFGYGADVLLATTGRGEYALAIGLTAAYQPLPELAVELATNYFSSHSAIATAGLVYILPFEGVDLRFALRFGEHWSPVEGRHPAVSTSFEQRIPLGPWFLSTGVAFDVYSGLTQRRALEVLSGFGGRAYVGGGFTL